jgi:arginine/lysine/ornithine decarboxylase
MTPFADAVLALRKDQRHGEQIVSFHALPWSQGRSLADSGLLGEKYRLLFGPEFLASEVSYSNGALDSYVRPTASLDLAQQLAADAFGASYTFS